MRLQSDPIINEFSQRLRSLLGNHLKKVILFGSRARGDNNIYSDYDFLIVVENRNSEMKEKITDICVDLLNKYDALVSFLLYSEDEWIRKKNFPIGLNIKKEGVEL